MALTTGSDIAFHSVVSRWEIQGDELALRSVLLNLLGNGVGECGLCAGCKGPLTLKRGFPPART